MPLGRDLRIAAAIAVLVGAALQFYCLLELEFYSVSWDEAGRILDAYDWSRDGRAFPGPWLPFYRIVVGSALWLHPDLIVTPRIVSGLFGLATIPAIGKLAHQLFQDRRTTLAALAGAAIFSQRVALSVAPLSSILFSFFILCGMACLAQWLRTRADAALYCSAAWIAVAGTVRYEGWLFGAAVWLIAWMRTAKRKRLLAGLALVLFTFPLAISAVKASNAVNPVGVVIGHAREYTAREIVEKNPAVEFVVTNAWNLNLTGFLLALTIARNGPRHQRDFGIATYLPLAVLSAGLLAASAAQSGPSWRMIGVWSLLTLPFTARVAAQAEGRYRWLGIAFGLAVLTAFGLDLRRIERQSGWAFPAWDRTAGAYMESVLENDPKQRIQIESSKFNYLNVLAASQHPEAFVLSPEPQVGADGSTWLLFRTPQFTERLDAQPNLVKVRQFGPWSLYCATESGCPD